MGCKRMGTLGSLGLLSSTVICLRRFSSAMQVAVLLPGWISSWIPLSQSLSEVKELSAREVVVDLR